MLPENIRSREIRLAQRSHGMPTRDNFNVVETTLIQPPGNQVLVKNHWFRVSISTRLMMSVEAEVVKGIPFPPLQIGDTLADAAIGEVMSAPAGSDLSVGDLVMHPYGWREFAWVEQQQCVLLGKTLLNPAAWLGHGWTAYAALTRGISVHDGDTVFVSSGAGAIGSMAGQIARRLGATRIIGSTGSAEKAAWMRQQLGYDATIERGKGSIAEQLRHAAPDGIDVLVDIVGGEQLAAAVSQAREHARYVLLGALSAELATSHSSKIAPVEIDGFDLIVKGVTLKGYSADEHPEAFGEWLQQLTNPGWQDLHFASSTYQGLDSAPQALADACSGKARGVVIVAL
ncbi:MULTISPECIES: MDR family NADP-dependent oxidoreductase [unclassified Pantoea]|uniref:MDR family NADP-dependent oxidoreductase n=1 Tax=unclassified Pantoea TaxID=2630326 RepID=UPI001CD21215|nr:MULTISPECIES: NADP-dependent oxidoreductase [unclassified Pantoea]MCA1177819.1 NADP-dependent oxidoreductase [Pantoea sp. alder69]MCA1252946.1 NADP-dependent oxidoreductase [Pantoea sp. alder70]MCA1266417.1 NADP-dependent oxidoreductase [Pantoea sp. alder81]